MPQTPQAPTLISAAFAGIFGHGTRANDRRGAGTVEGAYANGFHRANPPGFAVGAAIEHLLPRVGAGEEGYVNRRAKPIAALPAPPPIASLGTR